MIFYAMAILQGTVLVCYRYKNSLHLILIISILYGTHFIATSEQVSKVSKGAKIRNRYNQVPHLTQDTNGKVTNS